ncbi:MAG: hypothetical protein V3T05_09185 [Myxococcota bacterium]
MPALVLVVVLNGCGGSATATAIGGPDAGLGEVCSNGADDDGDGAVDCVDSECRDTAGCQGQSEVCGDGLDNDFDGDIDCLDADCSSVLVCVNGEICTDGIDNNNNGLTDCDDPACHGIHPDCGEVCGDGVDNDGDGDVDCNDLDCADVSPPCGTNVDGTTCGKPGNEHICACADGLDNDDDDLIDADDLHCFGPFDDDEETYATGIPGDNMGSNANRECPFDGNSGTGNDDLCCNPGDASTNVTPNGCDNVGCCEVDVNGNSTGEHVFVSGACVFAPSCGSSGTDGCACSIDTDCDAGRWCVSDDDTGSGFCSTCEPCTPNSVCANPCTCGEICFGGFEQPVADCGGGGGNGGPSCPTGVTECPGGEGDCDPLLNEICSNGCCYATCVPGVIPCTVTSECPTTPQYYCITGCCIEAPQ